LDGLADGVGDTGDAEHGRRRTGRRRRHIAQAARTFLGSLVGVVARLLTGVADIIEFAPGTLRIAQEVFELTGIHPPQRALSVTGPGRNLLADHASGPVGRFDQIIELPPAEPTQLLTRVLGTARDPAER